MHTKCKKKQNPISIFCFVFEKIHTSQYVYSLLVYLSFFYICNLLFTNCKYEKRKKKNLRNCIFQSTTMHKIEPKKKPSGTKVYRSYFSFVSLSELHPIFSPRAHILINKCQPISQLHNSQMQFSQWQFFSLKFLRDKVWLTSCLLSEFKFLIHTS